MTYSTNKNGTAFSQIFLNIKIQFNELNNFVLHKVDLRPKKCLNRKCHWPGEKGSFYENSLLTKMCHLSSRTTLLLTENRFITKKPLNLNVPDSPGENGTFSQNSVLPEMCHLLSRETLLFTGNRFITKKHLKLKMPDSPGENGTFSQNSVLPEMCHLSSRTTLLLTENR